MGEQIKPDTRLGFIREPKNNEREIKVKESELGRTVEEKDLPHCFGVILDGDPECNKCAISLSCQKWGEIYSKKEAKTEPKELKEEENVEAKDTVEVKPTKAKSKTKKDPEEAAEPEVVKGPSAPVEGLNPEWGVHEGDWTMKKGKKLFPKGYVNDRIMAMLKAGTTRENLEAFVAWIGYGKPMLGYSLRKLRKAKKLINDGEGNLKIRE